MTADRYFLPEHYQCNDPQTLDDVDSRAYWDERRVRQSLAYQSAVYRWAAGIIEQKQIRSVVDVGCGNAAKLAQLHQRFPNVSFCGIDQQNAISLCQQHYDFGEWLAMDLDQPSLQTPRDFELIIASDVIEHLDQPDALLAFMRAIATPKSLLLISTPERVRLRGRHNLRPGNLYHVREWSAREFNDYLRSRGFLIIEQRLLPAFRIGADWRFLRRAMRRWSRLRSHRYSQAVLMRPEGGGS